ncbi:MAG: ATP-binding protein [Reichenbachiella sp.]|uniref:ATP-binding response regulator n=1 Tax=Reichenbachiella sp. TaxID=2184521 RepID=UPI0032660296
MDSLRIIDQAIISYDIEEDKNEQLLIQSKPELKSKERRQQIQILEQSRKIRTLSLIGLISGLLLISAIALLIYFLLSNRAQAKNQLIEQEYQLDQMKSDLFLNIAHELRTPMTLILGPLSELETNDNLSAREKRCFKLIRSNSERLVVMADEILQVSKLGQEKMVVSLERIPLKLTLHQIWAGYQTLADKRLIAYKFEVALDQDLWIKAEKVKLEKILGELISNALKYSEKNDQVAVTAKIYNGQLEITVKDSGPGIDPAEQQQIFKRYYQSSKAGKRKLGGVGLGLSIVKSMVDGLEGSIRVESELGEGTSFIVLLPITLSDDASDDETYSNSSTINLPDVQSNKEHTPTIAALSKRNEEDDLNRPTVLVVDDQVDMLDFICDILYEDYHVLKAMNGKRGLEILLSGAYRVDLIVSDIMMPEMDGLEMLDYIKKQEELKSIPIIFLSAFPEDEPRIITLSEGINDFISKPFNRNSLLLRCHKVLLRVNEKSIKDMV